jgi:calcineurin-like phosphoesterase family protein
MSKFTNRFVISDTHFGHTNSWQKFKNADGSPLRPFSSNEEMDETMIERWNSVVKDNDVVYHLGDVIINKRYLDTVKRLNGHKRLIRGNHDIFKDHEYREAGFEQIWGVRVFVDKWILSHIPLHPDCVTDRFRVNVHGHLHGNQIMNGVTPDPRYLCVSVEHTDYRPLHFDEVEAIIQKRWQDANYSPPDGSGWGNGSGPR